MNRRHLFLILCSAAICAGCTALPSNPVMRDYWSTQPRTAPPAQNQTVPVQKPLNDTNTQTSSSPQPQGVHINYRDLKLNVGGKDGVDVKMPGIELRQPQGQRAKLQIDIPKVTVEGGSSQPIHINRH